VKKNDLELSFLNHWKLLAAPLGLPDPVRQHKFHPERRFRYDFCWVEQKLAVEIDGGSFIRGGHNTAKGQHADNDKHNESVRLGWRVLRFNTQAMKSPVEVVEYVIGVMCHAREITAGAD
jgi:very-short-patch-repair endonuclease